MSQVKFKATYNGANVEVVGGYDRPLNYYHLTIFSCDTYSNDDEYDEDVIWCNLDDDIPFPKNLDRYRSVLEDHGIFPPDGFWERCARKEGNVFYVYKDGTWNK